MTARAGRRREAWARGWEPVVLGSRFSTRSHLCDQECRAQRVALVCGRAACLSIEPLRHGGLALRKLGQPLMSDCGAKEGLNADPASQASPHELAACANSGWIGVRPRRGPRDSSRPRDALLASLSACMCLALAALGGWSEGHPNCWWLYFVCGPSTALAIAAAFLLLARAALPDPVRRHMHRLAPEDHHRQPEQAPTQVSGACLHPRCDPSP